MKYFKAIVFCSNPVQGFFRFKDIFQLYPLVSKNAPEYAGMDSLREAFPLLRDRIGHAKFLMDYLDSNPNRKVNLFFFNHLAISRRHIADFNQDSTHWKRHDRSLRVWASVSGSLSAQIGGTFFWGPNRKTPFVHWNRFMSARFGVKVRDSAVAAKRGLVRGKANDWGKLTRKHGSGSARCDGCARRSNRR
jgi:hypothetical protein